VESHRQEVAEGRQEEQEDGPASFACEEDSECGQDRSQPEDLGADSLDTVELVMALEEEFSLEIPDEDAEKITSVGDAVNYINEKADK